MIAKAIRPTTTSNSVSGSTLVIHHPDWEAVDSMPHPLLAVERGGVTVGGQRIHLGVVPEYADQEPTPPVVSPLANLNLERHAITLPYRLNLLLTLRFAHLRNDPVAQYLPRQQMDLPRPIALYTLRCMSLSSWLRGRDSNPQPPAYEAGEQPLFLPSLVGADWWSTLNQVVQPTPM